MGGGSGPNASWYNGGLAAHGGPLPAAIRSPPRIRAARIMNEILCQPADDTRSSLLLRVNNRDADAWLKLVKWIGPFILGWCRKARLQPADCDDVAQEVLQ